VMGKIELLNTPNGKLAQSIVDQGIPLHISSRAAGTVNSDNTVSIQQIYTYDLVCKPGFAGAVLHRVNESVNGNKYSNDVMGFLKKSENVDTQNKAGKNIITESVSVSAVDSDVNLRKEALEIIQENDKMRDIMKRTYKKLNEEDDFESIFGNLDNTDNGSDKKEDNKEGDEEDDKKEGDDDGVKILSVTPEYSDSESEESDENKEDEPKSNDEGDKKDKEKEDEESTDECGDRTADPKKAIFDDEKNTEKLTSGQKAVLDKLDQIKKKLESGKSGKQSECGECDGSDSKCESLIMAQYPISMSLNESNFAQFSALSEEQKSKVTAYLQDRGIYAPKMINEMWKNGIDYNVSEPVWLKYAPANYKALYNEAPQNIKESLANTAEYLIFESQRDINVFWENSGLESKAENHKRNMEFTNNLPRINESMTEKTNTLPYSMNLINAVVQMAEEYN